MEKIRASELRINNIVEADGIIQRVYRIWQNGAELVEQEDGDDDLDYHENDIHPIPLTEEWLLKFGFTKEVLGWKHWNLDLYLYLDNGCFESEQLPMFIYLKYVHQLQNLYFALTNEELCIK